METATYTPQGLAPAAEAAAALAWALEGDCYGDAADRLEDALTFVAELGKTLPAADRPALRVTYRQLLETKASLYRMLDEMARAETYAEGAWLRAAEAPTMDDWGFADYEARLGLV